MKRNHFQSFRVQSYLTSRSLHSISICFILIFSFFLCFCFSSDSIFIKVMKRESDKEWDRGRERERNRKWIEVSIQVKNNSNSGDGKNLSHEGERVKELAMEKKWNRFHFQKKWGEEEKRMVFSEKNGRWWTRCLLHLLSPFLFLPGFISFHPFLDWNNSVWQSMIKWNFFRTTQFQDTRIRERERERTHQCYCLLWVQNC